MTRNSCLKEIHFRTPLSKVLFCTTQPVSCKPGLTSQNLCIIPTQTLQIGGLWPDQACRPVWFDLHSSFCPFFLKENKLAVNILRIKRSPIKPGIQLLLKTDVSTLAPHGQQPQAEGHHISVSARCTLSQQYPTLLSTGLLCSFCDPYEYFM